MWINSSSISKNKNIERFIDYIKLNSISNSIYQTSTTSDKMSDFENKKKLLFDCLSSAEKCIEGTSLEQKQFARDEPTPRKLAIKKRFQGKESIFKRPQAPISKCLPSRRMPDFQVNKSQIKIKVRLKQFRKQTKPRRLLLKNVTNSSCSCFFL